MQTIITSCSSIDSSESESSINIVAGSGCVKQTVREGWITDGGESNVSLWEAMYNVLCIYYSYYGVSYDSNK